MKPSIDLSDWLEKNLFDMLPTATMVINASFDIVKANKAFEETFGQWQDKKCYQAYGNGDTQCTHCKHKAIFKDGNPRIFEDESISTEGRKTCRIIKMFPIQDESKNTQFIVETATDVSDEQMVRQKYRNLFEHVPCSVLIINRDFQIVETNQRARDLFGAIEGAYCYGILKKETGRCLNCAAQQTFESGKMHSGRSSVIGKNGKKVELLVTTVPYGVENGKFDLVLEMAVDITHTLTLQTELEIANTMMRSMISSSLFGIIAVDENDEISVFNQAAKRMLKVNDELDVDVDDLIKIFPTGFLEKIATSEGPVYFPDTKVCNMDGDSFPASLTGIKLESTLQSRGMAFWIHDISRIKKLEFEKLESERLAAVGKTVAGLAHGIKNVLTGLEGGEYMLNSGLQKADPGRIQKGMEMLNRNTNRVSTFVKEFLSFSKGQEIETELADPIEIAKEVVNTYSVKINQLGFQLKTSFQENISPAPMDAEGIHECLSNLLGNAIDACRISENGDDLQILLRVSEKNNTIIFEVSDNGCGMDYEVKKKVFTTFFTTKGLGGTGLGLLTTKKIIHQHGGQVEFESVLDQGTRFQISLPRERLPKLSEQPTES